MVSIPATDPWYAVHVRLRFEGVASAYLRALGQEEFLPICPIQTRPLSRVIQAALFPGYVFCRLDLINGPKLYHVPGFIQIVGAGKRPVALDEREIEAVRKIQAAHVPVQPCGFGRIGDRVRIESGPLAGIEGVVQSRKALKIIVSVPLLRRAITVAMQPEWLVLLEPSNDCTAAAQTPTTPPPFSSVNRYVLD